MRLSEIAKLIGGDLAGPDMEITGGTSCEKGTKGQITFAENARTFKQAISTGCSAVITQKPYDDRQDKSLVIASNPRLAFAMVLREFDPTLIPSPGVHDTAVISEDAEIGEGAYIGPFVVIGKKVRIGKNVRIMGLNYLGDGVEMGDDCIIYPGARLMDRVKLGNRVIINPGAIIGSDGFGYVKDGKKTVKIPQIGTVVLEDDVEIGANTTIDRATLGFTRIGRGTKIDNLVQIAHNVEIGEDVTLVAQVGIAGSCKIGDRTIMAGQAGMAQHITVGEDCMIGGQSGITKNIPPKSFYSDYPARPHREALKQHALIARLPEFEERLSRLEKELED